MLKGDVNLQTNQPSKLRVPANTVGLYNGHKMVSVEVVIY